MYRPVIDDQIDDDDDERRVLKSGEVLRVSMTMMDALDPVQRAMAAANTGKSLIGELARELYGDGLTDAERAAEAARAARNREIQDAWRSPPTYPFEDERRIKGTFELTTPVTDARARAEEAREKRLELIQNAWRFAR